MHLYVYLLPSTNMVFRFMFASIWNCFLEGHQSSVQHYPTLHESACVLGIPTCTTSLSAAHPFRSPPRKTRAEWSLVSVAELKKLKEPLVPRSIPRTIGDMTQICCCTPKITKQARHEAISNIFPIELNLPINHLQIISPTPSPHIIPVWKLIHYYHKISTILAPCASWKSSAKTGSLRSQTKFHITTDGFVVIGIPQAAKAVFFCGGCLKAVRHPQRYGICIGQNGIDDFFLVCLPHPICLYANIRQYILSYFQAQAHGVFDNHRPGPWRKGLVQGVVQVLLFCMKWSNPTDAKIYLVSYCSWLSWFHPIYILEIDNSNWTSTESTWFQSQVPNGQNPHFGQWKVSVKYDTSSNQCSNNRFY